MYQQNGPKKVKSSHTIRFKMEGVKSWIKYFSWYFLIFSNFCFEKSSFSVWLKLKFGLYTPYIKPYGIGISKLVLFWFKLQNWVGTAILKILSFDSAIFGKSWIWRRLADCRFVVWIKYLSESISHLVLYSTFSFSWKPIW